jgi:hypothetical protein
LDISYLAALRIYSQTLILFMNSMKEDKLIPSNRIEEVHRRGFDNYLDNTELRNAVTQIPCIGIGLDIVFSSLA